MKQEVFLRRKCLIPCLKLLIALLFASSLHAQSPDTTLMKVAATKDFKLTGDGSSSEWNKAQWINLPQRSGPIKYETRLKLLYSDSGIYCLFFCEDKTITATLKEDFADLFNEDVVEAFFWTDERLPVYFEYELSPYNYELAILVPNNNGDFFGWKPWHYEGNRKTRHATHLNKTGDHLDSWTAEFFIPYKLLKPLANVPPVKGTKWRANFYRIDYDSNSLEWSWQLTGTNFHDYKKFGTLIFE
jgi:hypothetical protein